MLNRYLSKVLLLFIAHFFFNTSFAAELSLLSPRALGIGGAGVAMGTRFSVGSNPATIGVIDERYDVYLNLPTLIYSSSNQTNFENALTQFQNVHARYVLQPTTNNQNMVTERLKQLQNVVTQRQLQLGGSISLPHLPVSLATFVNAQYFETRIALRRANPVFIDTTQPNYNTSVTLKAVALIETGASIAKIIHSTRGGSQRLVIGISPKLVSTRTYFYQTAAEKINFNQQSKQLVNESQLNVDVGILQEFAYTWKIGLSIRNVIPQKITYANHDQSNIGQQMKIGIANRLQNLIYTGEVDITKNNTIAYEADARFVKFGFEYYFNRGFIFRSGIFADLITTDNSGISLGFGFTSRYLDFDLGLSMTTNDYTTGIQFGTQY